MTAVRFAQDLFLSAAQCSSEHNELGVVLRRETLYFAIGKQLIELVDNVRRSAVHLDNDTGEHTSR